MSRFYDTIHYDILEKLADNISESKDLPRWLDAEVAIALNLPCKAFGSFRKLKESNTVSEIAEHSKDLPNFIQSLDHTKQLFKDCLGELENPFVYSIVTDFGGLRRARISDSLNVFVSCDAHDEAAALTAAILKTVVKVHNQRP